MTLPEGVRLILGPVSMAKMVATCVSGRTAARNALDEFLKHGEAMVAIDLDAFDKLVQPRRARWSSIARPLMHREIRTHSITTTEGVLMEKFASTEQVAALNHRI